MTGQTKREYIMSETAKLAKKEYVIMFGGCDGRVHWFKTEAKSEKAAIKEFRKFHPSDLRFIINVGFMKD